MPITPRVTSAGTAYEPISIGAVRVQFLVTGDDSNGSAAVFEVVVPGGGRLPAPAHSHDAYEETIYGLAGVSMWTVDGTQHRVGPGQALCIPRGAVHRFDNEGPDEVRAICVLSPAAIGPAFFKESAEVVNAAAGGPPDRAKMLDIYRRHGLTMAPPAPPMH